jgi:heme-degrading monooxygenase HmoA
VRWRTRANHHEVQEKGREGVLLGYHLRVGQITRDTKVPVGQEIREQRLDETEVGEGTTIVFIDAVKSAEWVKERSAIDVGTGIGLEQSANGLVGWDVFDAVLTPGEIILLTAWKDESTARAFEAAAAASLPEGGRVRRVRVVRDYSMVDRREAPQYYPEVMGR